MSEWGRGRESPTPFMVAEITDASALNGWKQVVMYSVKITLNASALSRGTSHSDPWSVERRFSKFFELREQLTKEFPDVKFPTFPPKKLLPGKEDIEQRRKELENFLNGILNKRPEISLSAGVCLFLEVPEQLRQQLLDAEPVVPPHLPHRGESPLAMWNMGGAPDESRVTWLLQQFRDSHIHKVVTIRTFEDWILKTKPALTEENVRLLYLGFMNQGGLLAEVGAFEHSEVSSIAALGLLCRLLSYEHMNSNEAALFRFVLQGLDVSLISNMRLQNHIHRNRGHSNRLDAFHVLRALDMSTDRLTAALQDDHFALREFRRWHDSLQSSLSFRTLHRSSQTRHRARTIESSGLLARPTQRSPKEYRKIAERAYTSVRMYLQTFAQEGDASGGLGDEAPRRFSRRPSLGEESGDEEILRATSVASAEVTLPSMSEPADGGGPARVTWRSVPCPEPSWVAAYQMRAEYQLVQYEQQSDVYIVRAGLRLPFPAHVVACLLSDHSQFIREALRLKGGQLSKDVSDRLKAMADGQLMSRLQGAEVIEPLQLHTPHEAYSELLECIISTPTAPHVTVRLWLLKTVRVIAPSVGSSSPSAAPASQPDAGTAGGLDAPAATMALPSYLFVYSPMPPVASAGLGEAGAATVGAGLGAETAGYRRASQLGTVAPQLMSLKPSGILIRPSGEGHSELSLVALLGKDSVRLVSGDLLGERLLFWKTIENALYVLERVCPLPSDFRHPLLEMPVASEPRSPCSPSSQASTIDGREEDDREPLEMVDVEDGSAFR